MKQSFQIPLLLALTVFQIWAGEDSTRTSAGDSVIQLDRMTVTATRTKRSLSDIPANVSIIPRAQIQSAPARNVSDLLANEPGVLVRRSVGMGEGIPSDISMRGIPSAYASTRTLIMVDGIPTNVSGMPFLILNEIPVEAIERVEVVRGPFSSLYGANAFSGVVNVQTREGNDTLHALVFGGLGNMAFFDAGLWSGWQGKSVGYTINGGFRGIGNYLGRDSALERHGALDKNIKVTNSDYYDQRVMGKLKWWATDRISIELQARYFHSDLGFGTTKYTPADSAPSDISTMGTKILLGPAVSVKVTDWLDIRAGGYVRRLIGEFNNETMSRTVYRFDTIPIVIGPGDTVKNSIASVLWDSVQYSPSYWKSVSDDGQVSLVATANLGSAGTVIAGGDYLLNRVDFGATVDRSTGIALDGFSSRTARISTLGLFIQDELRAYKSVKVIPGIRWDYHSIFKSVWSPKIGITASPSEWLHMRTSVGRAFRAPALSELYLPELPIQPTVSMIADSTLKPEFITAYDGGLDFSLFDGTIRPSITLFYNQMTNLISPKITSTLLTYLNTGKAVISFRNIGNAWSAGTELSCGFKPRGFFSGTNLMVNYAYTDSRDVTFESPLDYVPHHKGGVQVGYVFTRKPITAQFSLSELGVGPRNYLDWQAPSDSLGNGKNWVFDVTDIGSMRPVPRTLATYWLTAASIRISYKDCVWLLLEGENLFNVNYEETGGIRGAGRVVSFKVGYEL